MSQTSVEQENKTSWMIILAGLIVVLALVAYYLLADKGMVVRLAALLGGFAIALVIAAVSADGKRFVAYAKESVSEVKKVVWPTRKESTQMTLIVFAFVVVMALFLWLADKLIEWVVFSIFLGWK
ncbi:MAG: preprotein translocase subunit SecE [Burkholderiaceae bacterium]|jgi:preprotein translocase subunit SecE|uniref:preprotein translocase subunit SecE n=1 Tax=Polynucleobacter sp. MWH-Loch1C5 TaxID=2689108 RepID=UPI001C0CAEC6|nr:preprotein translocase subunit SecE [Polynucleobacter sp. MWH-Loch1C5]MBU3542432.1 preprotein translocase subunit SecE [Polynucleobacter sp. MWH-Loch1C5]NBV00390.1 preprotein translocase subunit SecE [Burkholderiaceae bacterium]